MTWRILRRFAQLIPLGFLLAVVAFVLVEVAPGDAAEIRAGPEATAAEIAVARSELGLDKPAPERLVQWVVNAARGDLGTSYVARRPVLEVIGQRLGATLHLAVPSIMIIAVAGVGLGVLAATHRDRAMDRAVRSLSAVAVATPSFLIALLLVLTFAFYIQGVLPYNGFAPISDGFWQAVSYLVLPIVALVVADIAWVARITRNSFLEVSAEDYVFVASAFGVDRFRIAVFYELRNSLLPVVGVLGIIAGHLLGGAVIIENVFGIPGIGQLLIQSFLSRDYPVAVGIVVVTGLAFAAAVLLSDLAQMALSPHLARESST